ncbi:Outer membrane protein beta-barrel domain-containing protein [Mariprofundus aestuarium]|uniref:Outer membrane protein beta-barrel domain-containing protein n=1 Tax=Mariprofundus aestuarium TaxID=1921086 RepID=A0A2K8L3E6_MARES|nr:outer membrane beta-barrel protein [Mariprofundus aestuarium]ATX80361.1 Outer membrane protein beta-barrel domain-containing protein [Mariprofundus aestuarium]
MRIGLTGKDKQTYAGDTELTFSSPTFVSYLAKIKYPVASNFDAFMLVGGTTAKIKGKSVSAASSLTQSKIKTGASFGAGVDYKIDDQISVGAEWVQVQAASSQPTPRQECGGLLAQRPTTSKRGVKPRAAALETQRQERCLKGAGRHNASPFSFARRSPSPSSPSLNSL